MTEYTDNRSRALGLSGCACSIGMTMHDLTGHTLVVFTSMGEDDKPCPTYTRNIGESLAKIRTSLDKADALFAAMTEPQIDEAAA